MNIYILFDNEQIEGVFESQEWAKQVSSYLNQVHAAQNTVNVQKLETHELIEIGEDISEFF